MRKTDVKQYKSEMALIAGLYQCGGDLVVMSRVQPEDFHGRRTRDVAVLMWATCTKGKINKPKLLDLLDEKELYQYLQEFAPWYDPGADLGLLADAVIEQGRREKLAELCNKTLRLVADPTISTLSLTANAETTLKGILNKGGAKGAELISSEAIAILDEVKIKSKGGRDNDILKSGISLLDQKIGGFEKADLVHIIARPSHFKSAFLMNLAMAATHQGKKVAYFSFETTKNRITRRVLSYLTGYSSKEIGKGKAGDGFDQTRETQRMINELAAAATKLEDMEFYIYDRSTNWQDVKAEFYKLYQKGVTEFYFDFLQYISTGNNKESKAERLKTISQGIKSIQKDCENVPRVFLGVQASRKPQEEKRNPLAHEIDYCSSAEQDADMSLTLCIPAKYGTGEKNQLKLKIAKNRDGALGMIDLTIKKGLKVTDYDFTGEKDSDDWPNSVADVPF